MTKLQNFIIIACLTLSAIFMGIIIHSGGDPAEATATVAVPTPAAPTGIEPSIVVSHPVRTATDVRYGVTALEFLRLESQFVQEAPLMKRVVIGLIAKGYKNVPDWTRLSSVTKDLILLNGYRDQDIGVIAEEAALKSGMTR